MSAEDYLNSKTALARKVPVDGSRRRQQCPTHADRCAALEPVATEPDENPSPSSIIAKRPDARLRRRL